MYKRRENVEIVRFRYVENRSSIFIRPIVVIFSDRKIFISFLLELYQCPPIFFYWKYKRKCSNTWIFVQILVKMYKRKKI